MRAFSADDVDAALDFPALIEELAEAMRGGFLAPHRHHHAIERAGGRRRRISSCLRGRRAPRAPALAARHLARADAKSLLVVGAGALAPYLARAHASVRPLSAVTVWNRSPEGARRLAAALAAEGLPAQAGEELSRAVAEADVISCATLSTAPLIEGRWLKTGQHLDLVGAFSMSMREADDEDLRRARIFVDTEAACTEGGDVAIGLADGVITEAEVAADLPALCRRAEGRRTADEITLFKSVGAAIEDLAAAILVWRKSGGAEP